MDVLIVVAAVTAAGLVAGIVVLAWLIYGEPMLRRRYERGHHRSKATAGSSKRLGE